MRERACRAASRIAWIAAALPVAAAPSVDGTNGGATAAYSCNFQGSWQDCGFAAQAKASDRITPIEVAGVAGVRLETLPGDEGIAGSGHAERADLALSAEETGCSQGQEQWWSHELLFPEDYVAPRRSRGGPWPWGVVFDFHHTGPTGQANFEIDVSGDPPLMRFAISAGPVVSSGAPGSPTRRWAIGPIMKNHWYQFVYHVRWSAGRDGFFDAWVDGRRVLAYRGPTLYAGLGCYLKLANYHTPVGSPVSVVHARIQRAASEAGLDLRPVRQPQP
ncbi:MAG TPA: heparin lyase I family protein [Steroidobacteraceae bacterium]|nr:heparin lyase I family protein [Steroidobacteraceae bacterium]